MNLTNRLPVSTFEGTVAVQVEGLSGRERCSAWLWALKAPYGAKGKKGIHGAEEYYGRRYHDQSGLHRGARRSRRSDHCLAVYASD